MLMCALAQCVNSLCWRKSSTQICDNVTAQIHMSNAYDNFSETNRNTNNFFDQTG